MNSRERVLTALDGREPDRVPRALNFYRVDVSSLAPPGQWREAMVDVRFVRFPPSPEEEDLARRARPHPPDTILGTAAQVASYLQWDYRLTHPARRNPLARARSLEDLRRFSFPDTRGAYVVEHLSGQVDRIHARGQAAGGNLPHLGGELFEAAWRLRGLENFLEDLVIRPEWADFLLDRLCDLACRNAATLARAGIDLLALDDDVGMPDTMMIAPATWERFFKPRMARIIATAHEINPELRVLYHSDGYFEPIIGGLLEIGVDAINPLQPEHMDAARIRRRFGPRPALWGCLGRQGTFIDGSPAIIRQEVRERIRTLGRRGLILCPAYDIEEPPARWENIRAFLDAVVEFGAADHAGPKRSNDE